MTTGNMSLDAIIPSEYELEIPMTTSASILRKSALRIYPTRQATYKPYNSNWIEFYVSSPTEVLLTAESYFIFDITRTDVGANGLPSTQYDNSISFDFPGIHSIIKTFQVRSGGTNVMLDDMQYYHTFAAQWFKLHEGRDQMDHNAVDEGRSLKGEYGWNNQDSRQNFYLTGVQPSATMTSYWYDSFDSGDKSYSLILPPVLFTQFLPNLTTTSTPVTYASGTTYTIGQTVLYNSSASPLSLALYPNSVPAGSSVTLPVGLNNNPNPQTVVLPSIWKALQSTTGNTPATGSVYWIEVPFTYAQNSNARKDVEAGDILMIEVYIGGTTATLPVKQTSVDVIAVDQLTGIIVVSGQIPFVSSYSGAAPTITVTSLTTAYTTTRVIGNAEVDMAATSGAVTVTANLVNPAFIKSILVTHRPSPLNVLPGRMEIIRYNGSRQRVKWHPLSSFFTFPWPLYVSKNGITFRIEIEFGDRCMNTGQTPLGSVQQCDYQIDDPKYVGFFSAAEPSVMRDVITKWNSADGLIYYCPSYVFREISGVFGEKDVFLNFTPGVRSARGVLLTIQSDQISSANTALARAMNSLSTFLRSGVRSWQAQIGAHMFPVEKVDLRENNQVPDYLANEAHHLLSKWSMKKHTALRKEEFRPWNTMYNSSTDSTVFIDANVFIIYIDLSRSNTANSALTGSDVSITPLQIHLERGEVLWGQTNGLNPLYTGSNYGAVPGIPLYRAFIIHDKFIRMSSSVLTTLQ